MNVMIMFRKWKISYQIGINIFLQNDYWRPKLDINIFIQTKGITSVIKIWTQANEKLYDNIFLKCISSLDSHPRDNRSNLSLDRINAREEPLKMTNIFEPIYSYLIIA